jgi:hypothetical protein
MAVSYIHGNRENYVYILYVNTFAQLGEQSDFWNGYVEQSKANPKTQNIIFDTENYFDMTQKSVMGNHYFEKMIVLIDSGTMDAIVMEPEQLSLLGESGRLIDLNDQKTQRLLERYVDRLITISYTDETGTRDIPIGIDLSGSLLTAEAYTQCAIGLSATVQHTDAVVEFLDYVLEE